MAKAIFYLNGIPKLIDENAIIDINSLHRPSEEGPAICWPNGSEEYWENGLRHRLDGPAAVDKNGHISWWVRGKLHRLDGPAVINPDGTVGYWIKGKQYLKDKWLKEREKWIKS